jgi:DNA polymerase III subunit chi
MVEVSFYHLQSQPLEQALPRLLEKVNERGLKALVRMKEAALMELLNGALWTYKPASFLPHGSDVDPTATQHPILLTCAADGNANQSSVLVLLEDSAASDLADFDRCLYMFDGNNDMSLHNARQRWKQFKADGVDVTYWQQEGNGWQKKA